MVCIYCGSDLKVINSRAQKRVNQVWRRRQCQTCGALFTTHEAIDLADSLRVHASDGSLSPFLRDKLFISIHRSCQHRHKALLDAQSLTATVVGVVGLQSVNAIIDTSLITKTTSTVLHHFDEVAAVHYDAFHPQGPSKGA